MSRRWLGRLISQVILAMSSPSEKTPSGVTTTAAGCGSVPVAANQASVNPQLSQLGPSEPSPSQIVVNGAVQAFVSSMTIASLLEQLQIPTRGVAVELNEQIVPRSQHAQKTLQPGDRLEVVSLVGGG